MSHNDSERYSIELPPDWRHATPEEKIAMENELKLELDKDHVLYDKKCETVARRGSFSDDVLFLVPSQPKPFAVVHLTWASRREEDPTFPSTIFYSSNQDFIDNY